MPRKRRIVLPGEIHHIMARGIDGRKLFSNDEDYEYFLSLLKRILITGNCRCYAWVLMSNHYHLLLRPFDNTLTQIMRSINGSYARFYNKKYSRHGYLFQDRYKSLATQEYWYLRELIRYIHLNPIRAGIVKNLEELNSYPWCGHAVLMGNKKAVWQAANETLSRFGSTIGKGRSAYFEFLSKGTEEEFTGWNVPTSGADAPGEKIDDRVAGEAAFVRQIIDEIEKERQFREKMLKQQPKLEDIILQLSKENNVTVQSIYKRGRKNVNSRIRIKLCQRAVLKYGYTISSVASFLGVHSSSVLRMIQRDEKQE